MLLSKNHTSSSSPQGVDRERFFSRRAFLGRAGAAAGATVALASGGLFLRTGQRAAAQQADLDPAILNFALNLEYLEAEYYLRASTDTGIEATAYHGASPIITSKDYLAAAAGILAVEAYHAGILRTLLFELGQYTQDAANQISKLRNTLSDEGSSVTDQGIRINGEPNLVPADSNSIAFSRSTRQVLYGGVNAPMGLFFPMH
jgi:Ferritin-like domain